MEIVIDVRTKEEFEGGHAEGAVNIALAEISEGKIGMLGGIDKNTMVNLYCRSGARSEAAKQKLESLGFTNVHNLGGLDDAVTFIQKNK